MVEYDTDDLYPSAKQRKSNGLTALVVMFVLIALAAAAWLVDPKFVNHYAGLVYSYAKRL